MSEINVVKESFVFPTKHLPNCFTNLNLYDKLDNIYNSYDNIEEILNDNFILEAGKIKEFEGYNDNIFGLKKGTEPIDLYISKPNGANRIISVVNPLVLIPLHYYINKYHEEILEEQVNATDNYDSSSRFSFEEGQFIRLYDYDEVPTMLDYANVVQPNYQYNLLNKQKICDGKYYHLGVDINNFFNSIYTHTISWNLKNDANKIIFDNLDVLNRTLNRNETKGIVIGPYTSSLFSEIILSKVDRNIIQKCKEKDISFVRFCDDYDFYSDSKESLENDTRLLISESLSNYKLDLNMNKMKLEEFPFISLNTIQNKNVFLLMKRIEENAYEDKLEFIEDVMNEINNSVKIKYSNCKYLLKILTTKIKKNVITKDYFDNDTAEILLDFLINMMFKQNMISPDAFNLIVEIFNLTELDKDRIIIKWIKKRNSRISHIKEITDIWLAYLIIKLNICNDESTKYMLVIMSKSDLGAILSFEYFNKNNLLGVYKRQIKEYLTNIKKELIKRYSNDWKKASYYSKYWLLFYTNCISWKIHTKQGFKNTILFETDLNNIMQDVKLKKKLNLFKIMLDNDVKFIHFE
jgi:hypothetical protein